MLAGDITELEAVAGRLPKDIKPSNSSGDEQQVMLNNSAMAVQQELEEILRQLDNMFPPPLQQSDCSKPATTTAGAWR